MAGSKNRSTSYSGDKNILNNTHSKSSLGASFKKDNSNLSRTQTRRVLF